WGMGGAFISLQMSRFMAKMAMGVKLVDGKSGQADLDWLHQTVGQLTRKAGLPMPEVGIYESAEVNAFATGPSKKRSLVAVSSGLLNSMRREEVEGVLAHEVAHIQNGDMVTLTLIQGVVNAFVLFFSRIIANIVRQMVDEKISHLVFFVTTIVFDIAFGILGSMVVAWFSRAREFRADAGGARLAGKANMIGALQRLMQNKALVDNSQPQLATMKIAGGKGFMSLISTHPPLETRIAALQQAQIL
ncbi:MAG: protease HtpX, partial [Acidobacteria bacterium]|nr:protease HtpX [Acidobacteriota bacterium]